MSKNIPYSSKTQSITVRIDKDKISTIDKLSKEKYISRNKLIIQFIDFALQNLQTNIQ